MDDWIDYEAMAFALGGDIACPECGMGFLIPTSKEDAQEDTQRVVCEVCDEEFELATDCRRT